MVRVKNTPRTAPATQPGKQTTPATTSNKTGKKGKATHPKSDKDSTTQPKVLPKHDALPATPPAATTTIGRRSPRKNGHSPIIEKSKNASSPSKSNKKQKAAAIKAAAADAKLTEASVVKSGEMGDDSDGTTKSTSFEDPITMPNARRQGNDRDEPED